MPEAVKKTSKRKSSSAKSSKKEVKVAISKSKRKRSIARASVKNGPGTIRINGRLIDTIEPTFIKDEVLTPINFSDMTKDLCNKLSISVNVHGGGVSSQAQACASAIAKAIVEYSGSAEIKREYLNYNRNLLIDDPRRVEPKKFLGPKARARFQTSYR